MTSELRGWPPLRIRTADVLWQAVDGDVIVLDLRGSTYFRLNPSGAFLWDLLADDAPYAVLVDQLMARYQLDQARAASDVEAFLHILRERKLLVD